MAPAIAVFHYHRGVGLSRMGRQSDAKKALMLAREKASADESLQTQISEALIDL